MGFLGAALVSLAALTSAAAAAGGVPSASANANVKRQVSQLRDKYDFVVVGGGTTGLTVADRLSEAFPASASGPVLPVLIARGLG